MKKILIYLSILSAAFVFTPNKAEARPHSYGHSSYVSGHSACGCPIYTKKIFTGRDCYGRPIYTYSRLASNCKCNRNRGYYNSSKYYNSRHYTRNSRKKYYRSHHHTSRRFYTRGYNNCGSRIRVTYRR